MQRYRFPIILATGLIMLLIGVFALSSGRNTLAEEPAPILEYPTFQPTPTVSKAPPAAPGLNSSASTTLLAAGFDTPESLAGWQFVDLGDVIPGEEAVWSVENGALKQNRTAAAGNPSFHETLAVTGDSAWTDYTITTQVYDQQNATFGLVARRQGNSFYRFRMIADVIDGGPKQVLERVVDGVATPLATQEGPGYARRQWHTISMRVSGTQIQVSVNGQIVAQANDSTLTNGQAGLSTIAFGGIVFDNVTINMP